MAFDVEFTNGADSAHAWLTSEPIVPSQGYGGHPLAARPKRRGLTVWQGRQPFSVDFPILLYRGGPGHSVEQDRIALERMATIESVEDYTYKYGVLVNPRRGLTLPIPSAVTEWWVEELTWGEEVREPPERGGYLTRKLCNVKLLERVDDQVLGSSKQGSKNRNLTIFYFVKGGDTLAKIAAKLLGKGDAAHVDQIKKYNPGIRSDGNLHPGKTVLRIPSGPNTKTNVPGIEIESS